MPTTSCRRSGQSDYSSADDTRFLKVGTTYLVAAAVDPESSRLVSKVRHPIGVAFRDLLVRVTPPQVAVRSLGRATAWQPPDPPTSA